MYSNKGGWYKKKFGIYAVTGLSTLCGRKSQQYIIPNNFPSEIDFYALNFWMLWVDVNKYMHEYSNFVCLIESITRLSCENYHNRQQFASCIILRS